MRLRMRFTNEKWVQVSVGAPYFKGGKRMSRKGKGNTEVCSQIVDSPLCAAIATKGISTAADFANFMSALMSDLVEGRIAPSTANATCNASGKLLKAVEMQMKYGTPTPSGKVLTLAMNNPWVTQKSEVPQ